MELKDIIKRIDNFGCEHASYWGCAIAGEVGEACNLIKKYERDGEKIKLELELELADIFIYTVLIAQYFDIDLEFAILKKLRILKDRKTEVSRK